MNFLAGALREEGGFKYKKALVRVACWLLRCNDLWLIPDWCAGAG